ncbi:NAD(P)-dependent oxidoreductase [Salinifilum aidingensis]
MTTIAFLGTGTMGEPMARNLLAAGFDVRAWNRTSSKAQHLAAHGAHVADTPAGAARGADVLITMLLDAGTTVRAAEPAYKALDEDGIWLQMATIGLSGMREVARIAGSSLVDAPVLGTRKPAEQATLVALAAGDPAVRERVAPVLDAMAERTLWLGEDAAGAAGTRLKLVANNWVLALTNAVGESIALARHLGADPQRFLQAISGTATDSPYAQLKGGAILGEDFAPSFTTSGAAKDADLIAEAGEGLRLDLAEGARQRLRRAVAAGHGDEDMVAAYFASFE